MSDTTISRRYAIRTGGLAAILAGLTGTVTTAPAVAAPRSDLVAALCAEPTPDADARFAEWVDQWQAERATVSAEQRAILDQIKAYVPADRQWELVGKLSDLSGDLTTMETSLYRELMFRHLPGLEPMLRLIGPTL